MSRHPIGTVTTNELDIAYERHGRPGAPPVILLHGFPYDVRGYDDVARILAAADAEVFVPYLRGFGPTRLRRPSTMRSGQQAALAGDLIAMIEALGLDRPVVAGYDWGGRAATAPSLHNADFVAVAVHSYRHRFHLAAGAPEYQADEDRIARLPQIQVPTIAVSALDDGLRTPKPTAEHAARFPNLIDDVRLRVGHNPPQEAPGAFADAVARIRFRAGA